MRPQHQLEREAEGLLGLGARRVVVQLVDEAARLVHHVYAEDGHRGCRTEGGRRKGRGSGAGSAARARGFPACPRRGLPFWPEVAREQQQQLLLSPQPEPRSLARGAPWWAPRRGRERGGRAGLGVAGGERAGPRLPPRTDASPPPPPQPPKDDKKKKDAGKSAKKDKDPVNKSGGKAKKKVRGGRGSAAPRCRRWGGGREDRVWCDAFSRAQRPSPRGSRTDRGPATLPLE